MQRNTHVFLAALALTCTAAPGPAEVHVLFVSAQATGARDGRSWSSAFNDLQDALDAARVRLPQPTEIWVAEGVYHPDRGTGDRLMSYSLSNGVELYGGFAGDEVDRSERDPKTHETVLSGDILGNDDLTPPVTSNCCSSTGGPGCDDAACFERVNLEIGDTRHCEAHWGDVCAAYAKLLCCDLCRPQRCDNAHALLTAIGPNLDAVADGFSITGAEESYYGFGKAGVVGSGLFADNASVVVRNCLFRENASEFGGAIYVRFGAATIEDSTFLRNVKHNRAAILNTVFTDLGVLRCTFESNDGVGLSAVEGGRGAATIRESRFVGNRGSAITNGFVPTYAVDCDFIDNHAPESVGGGAIRAYPRNSPDA